MPPLVECLQEYCSWLRRSDPSLDPWGRVLLVDDLERDGVLPVPPADFLERWHQIVGTVAAHWVNFEFVGLRAGVLVVAVVWRAPMQGDETWPVHPIWVNWSGPSQVTLEGVCCRAVHAPSAGVPGPTSYEMHCPYCSDKARTAGSLGKPFQGLRVPFSAREDAERAVREHVMASHPYWAG